MKIHRKREAPAKGSNHKFKKAIGLTKLPPVRMLLSFFVPFVFFVVNPSFQEKSNHKEHKGHKGHKEEQPRTFLEVVWLPLHTTGRRASG